MIHKCNPNWASNRFAWKALNEAFNCVFKQVEGNPVGKRTKREPTHK